MTPGNVIAVAFWLLVLLALLVGVRSCLRDARQEDARVEARIRMGRRVANDLYPARGRQVQGVTRMPPGALATPGRPTRGDDSDDRTA